MVDAGAGEDSVELAPRRGSVVLVEDGIDHGLLFNCAGGFVLVLAVGLEVIDVELQDVLVFDGVGDRVGVQLFLEHVFGGDIGGLLALDFHLAGVVAEDRRAGEAEELRVREKILDRLVVVAKLRAVAFVEDEDDALVAQRFQAFLVFALVGAVEGDTQFLDGGDDDLVGVVGGQESPDQGFGVGVFLDTIGLEFVEFLAGLAVEVLAVDDEQAFLDVRV